MGLKAGFFILMCVGISAIAFQLLAVEPFQQFVTFQAMMALTVFSLFLASFALWRSWRIQRKLDKLEAGLHQFERHINERFDALPSHVSDNSFSPSSLPLPRADMLSQARSIGEDIRQTRFDFDTPSLQQSGEETDNVVPFLRLVQSEEKTGKSSLPTKELSFNKASFHLRLQPIVHLESRKISAFSIVPGFATKDDSFVPLKTARAEMDKSFSDASCDLQLIESAITLVKSLANRAEDIMFYVPMSGGILERPKAFAEFVAILKRNRALGTYLTIGFDQPRLSQMKRAAQNRLVDLSDIGFSLGLNHCQNLKEACEQVTNGRFESLEVSIGVLETLETSTVFSTEIAHLRNAAKDGMNVMVSGVETEHQVMRLLDQHMLLASGPFLSEPKLPAIETNATHPAER